MITRGVVVRVPAKINLQLADFIKIAITLSK